ncbi:hypothetical protein BOTBODRAFT_317063 [Botryobasidium botryosum FD-172 SS1]|uniref:Transcription factor IIIC subunit 5 HTH domain-containing protein n=1 Tax=Botryobasidium botryosum (strain FD-172 SS1) TaxID=930990 RepID=A0A067N9D6_BOTB1|nr:hypothetical protein BOTBODRAFT_317063 [Botryobasidium botryosum FD-172 SS1]
MSAGERSGPGSRESREATLHALPSTSFYSVEYPGYVSPGSIPAAIRTLGGQTSLDQTFKHNNNIMELKFRPDDPFSHPVCGEATSTSNLVLKITKRRKKKSHAAEGSDSAMDVDSTPAVEAGEFIAEVMGSIPKTVRFRSMVDFQYAPDTSDRIIQLQKAMEKLDARAIQAFRFAPEKEDYTAYERRSDANDLSWDPEAAPNEDGLCPKSNLRLLPPPLFSRQGIQQNYDYSANVASIVQTIVDEQTGEQKDRLINKHRFKGLSAICIMYEDREVPQTAPQSIEGTVPAVKAALLARLKELFEQRPVWSRLALLNQFSALEAKEIHYTKSFIPLVAYIFNDGPWRDTLVRFGYDPRLDPSARIYQRLYFRNKHKPHGRASITKRRSAAQGGAGPSEGSTQGESQQQPETEPPMFLPERFCAAACYQCYYRDSHIFDGVHALRDVAGWQLCDIHDPLLKQLIEDDSELREECHEMDGWYTEVCMERIRAILRRKYFGVLDGQIVTDEDCGDILARVGPRRSMSQGRVVTTKKPRADRRNRAKNVPGPEEITAARLRLAVQRIEEEPEDDEEQEGEGDGGEE